MWLGMCKSCTGMCAHIHLNTVGTSVAGVEFAAGLAELCLPKVLGTVLACLMAIVLLPAPNVPAAVEGPERVVTAAATAVPAALVVATATYSIQHTSSAHAHYMQPMRSICASRVHHICGLPVPRLMCYVALCSTLDMFGACTYCSLHPSRSQHHCHSSLRRSTSWCICHLPTELHRSLHQLCSSRTGADICFEF